VCKTRRRRAIHFLKTAYPRLGGERARLPHAALPEFLNVFRRRIEGFALGDDTKTSCKYYLEISSALTGRVEMIVARDQANVGLLPFGQDVPEDLEAAESLRI
jgi:hypothetical protein